MSDLISHQNRNISGFEFKGMNTAMFFSCEAITPITFIGAVIFIFCFYMPSQVPHSICWVPLQAESCLAFSTRSSADVSSCDPPFMLHSDLCSILTWMCGSGFDLDGGAAPAVLLHLRHPLTGHLVGVVRGAHCDLVLDDALTFQLLSAVTAKQKHGAIEPQGLFPLAVR